MRKNNHVKHEKDFDWRPRKENPYHKQERVNWSWRAKIGTIILSLLGVLLLALYHPFFRIQELEVIGLKRIDHAEFENAIYGMIDYRKFFVLPSNSYLLVDTREIEEVVKSRFPVESVNAKKVFPQKITIAVEEKISTVIYDSGIQYSYLDLEGKIVEKIRMVGDDEWNIVTKTVSTTLADGTVKRKEVEVERSHTPRVKNIILEMGDYPIVYDMNGGEGSINDSVLKPEIVRGIIEWFDMLEKQTDIPFGYMVLASEQGDAEIRTREGWGIMVDLLERAPEQFEDLQFVLREKVARPNLFYIDLRYQDRVYWK